MVEHDMILCWIPYIDYAIFQLSKMKLLEQNVPEHFGIYTNSSFPIFESLFSSLFNEFFWSNQLMFWIQSNTSDVYSRTYKLVPD